MSKRHSDAIAIQGGACNPAAIANSILDAVREVRDDEHGDACQDTAVRLMVHQLAYICNVAGVDENYRQLTDECERLSK